MELEISHLHLYYISETLNDSRSKKTNAGVLRKFTMKNPYLLFLFADNCRDGDNVNLSIFADGLNQDLEAVINAVVGD